MITRLQTDESLADIVGRTITHAPRENGTVRGFYKVYKTKLDGTREFICTGENALTNAGRDWIFAQLYTNGSAGTRGANFLSLSTSSTNTSATDTTWDGEITGSGLARVDLTSAGTVSHAAGTNTASLSNTFTATGAVAGIHKAALHHSSSSTLPVHYFNFATDTSLVSGERITIEWGVTVT